MTLIFLLVYATVFCYVVKLVLWIFCYVSAKRIINNIVDNPCVYRQNNSPTDPTKAVFHCKRDVCDYPITVICNSKRKYYRPKITVDEYIVLQRPYRYLKKVNELLSFLVVVNTMLIAIFYN